MLGAYWLFQPDDKQVLTASVWAAPQLHQPAAAKLNFFHLVACHGLELVVLICSTVLLPLLEAAKIGLTSESAVD